jgi:hypothetical protein
MERRVEVKGEVYPRMGLIGSEGCIVIALFFLL